MDSACGRDDNKCPHGCGDRRRHRWTGGVRELTIRYPGMRVSVSEKEDRVAAHQSGHNSGVVHAGIYYALRSLKARVCARGRSLLRVLGKLVGSSGAKLSGLAEIERRALPLVFHEAWLMSGAPDRKYLPQMDTRQRTLAGAGGQGL